VCTFGAALWWFRMYIGAQCAFIPSSCDCKLAHDGPDVDISRIIQHARYPGQRSFCSKVIVRTHTHCSDCCTWTPKMIGTSSKLVRYGSFHGSRAVYVIIVEILLSLSVWLLFIINLFHCLSALLHLSCFYKCMSYYCETYTHCRMTNYELLHWLVETRSRDVGHNRTLHSWPSDRETFSHSIAMLYM